MKAWAVLLTVLAVLFLTACDTVPRLPTVQKVPVPVPCVDRADVPVAPAFLSDAEYRLITNDYTFVLTLWAERLRRMAYEGKLEAVLGRCIDPISAPGPPG